MQRETRQRPLTRVRQGLYNSFISRGLEDVYNRADTEERWVGLSEARLVIFSDHHKGGRNQADDFWRCEAAYNAALGHYLEHDYALYVLGDAEELWEEGRDTVLAKYPDTFQLEGQYLARGKYERFWGNHDSDWSQSKLVEKELISAFGIEAPADWRVREGIHLRFSDGGHYAGRIFLVHGHQGTIESQALARVSRVLVREVWARVQRQLRRPWNTPARDHKLRARHDAAMFRWAGKHPDKPVLIAGHTHRPVFWSRRDRATEAREAQTEVERLGASLASLREQQASQTDLASCRARYESVRAKRETTPDLAPTEMPTPCYFNTGCCSFGDGSITGLEIAGGDISLVRWPWPYGKQPPAREVLDSLALRKVFDLVR